jgi:hypothetical protein
MQRFGVVGIAVVLAACAGPVGRRGVPDDGAGHDVAYLVTRLEIPLPEAGASVGADLDGLDSTGGGASCETRSHDFASTRDPEEVGVDNVGGAIVRNVERIVGRSLDRELANAIASGRLAIAIEIRDLRARGDGRVMVVVSAAVPLTGVLDVDADGAPLPGQIVRATPLVYALADLRGGTLVARTDPMSIPVAGEPIPMLPFEALGPSEIALDLDVDESGRRVAIGEVGTSLDVAAILEQVRGIDPAGVELARAILARFADLGPSPGDASICERISIGFALEAVEVEVVR